MRRILHPPKWLAILLPMLVALVGRAWLLPELPIPTPLIHDEFSYLLAADTFASGRLANPTPPCWEYLETFHVNMQPAYASVYPPGQGAALAVGQVFLGHPWWGVWLSVGAMCAAASWAMLAWLAPWWSLLGGVLVASQFGFYHYWANSYWGGAVAATGGGLLLGAIGRLARGGWSASNGVAAAAGLAILANSRPWEGLALAVPLIAWAAWRFTRSRGGLQQIRLRRFGIPFLAILIPATAATMFYFWRTTGSPLRMPYAVNLETYGRAPVFLWESQRPAKPIRHQMMRRLFTEWEPKHAGADRLDTFDGWLAGLDDRTNMLYRTHFDFVFLVIVLAAQPALLRHPRSRVLLVASVIFLLAQSVVRYSNPHYSAPIVSTAVLIKMSALRRVVHWSRKSRLAMVLAAPLVLLLAWTTISYQRAMARPQSGQSSRAVLLAKLDAEPGLHLVVVRYGAAQDYHQDWVYNRADVGAAKVVWAREIVAGEHARLRECYPGRRLWLFDHDRYGQDGRPRFVPLD